MSIQLLVGRHGLDRTTQGTDTIGSDLLESDLLDETIQVHAAICLGIAVGRQGMIRAGSIIACAFRSIWTHKDTAGVLDSLRDSGVIRRLDNQVFGSVLVREVYDFPRIFQYDETAVR